MSDMSNRADALAALAPGEWPADARHNTSLAVAAKGASILLVEDDLIVREVLASTLMAHGYDVIIAGTVAEARRAHAQHPAKLVIVDIGLPDGSGHDLAHALRHEGDPAVIFVTSRTASDERIRGLSVGDDYVLKPVDP
jgi:DNA-binding response OmpR family regulator